MLLCSNEILHYRKEFFSQVVFLPFSADAHCSIMWYCMRSLFRSLAFGGGSLRRAFSQKSQMVGWLKFLSGSPTAKYLRTGWSLAFGLCAIFWTIEIRPKLPHLRNLSYMSEVPKSVIQSKMEENVE